MLRFPNPLSRSPSMISITNPDLWTLDIPLNVSLGDGITSIGIPCSFQSAITFSGLLAEGELDPTWRSNVAFCSGE
ncbi:MAG: hypothetical protein KAR40_17615 [Candidatus Sabulitectum sp.]|nr:hypothetical protein [Candidatus Sabulitectum sp.]